MPTSFFVSLRASSPASITHCTSCGCVIACPEESILFSPPPPPPMPPMLPFTARPPLAIQMFAWEHKEWGRKLIRQWGSYSLPTALAAVSDFVTGTRSTW